MDDEWLIRTELEFAVADAVWRHELIKAYGSEFDEDDLSAEQRKGEGDSSLRGAFADRKRWLQAFRLCRGTA
ncbi:hypothetical protein MPAR168_08510 [Methylorubrum populi]|uniref:Uncharacterized protein n=1 Tax=Methylobacterium radiotolerans TaxID=31998 RepID=A0ABU7T677_9HYPH